MPHDYKRALADMAEAEQAMRADAERDNVADAVGVPHTGTSAAVLSVGGRAAAERRPPTALDRRRSSPRAG